MPEFYAYLLNDDTYEVIGERILLESRELYSWGGTETEDGVIGFMKTDTKDEEFYYIPYLENMESPEIWASFQDEFDVGIHPKYSCFESWLLDYHTEGVIAKTTYNWLCKKQRLIDIDSLFDWLDKCVEDQKSLSLKTIKEAFYDGSLKRPATGYMTRYYKLERNEEYEEDEFEDDERYSTCRE